MKRLIPVLLAVIMTVTAMSIIPMTASAQPINDYYYYLLPDDTVAITGYKGSDLDVVIPSDLDGYPVVRISDEAFCDCSSLTSVTISDATAIQRYLANLSTNQNIGKQIV